MRALAGLVGIVVIIGMLWDAFEVIILPRRVTRRFRLARFFYRSTWRPLSRLCAITSERRAENLLSFYGPISVLCLLIIWAVGLIFGFGLLQYAAGSALHLLEETPRLATDLYFSGTNFFTLGLGDVYPRTVLARILTVLEAGMGFGFLALIISYLPALNQEFSRREATISTLDERAGSPATASEMIRRNMVEGTTDELQRLLASWEEWAAELLESHLSYPLLAYFRSHHDNQSWLGALTTILDTSALVCSICEGALQRQARMTFAIARHAVVDLSIIFRMSPAEPDSDRLPPADLAKLTAVLTASGFKLQAAPDAHARLSEFRRLYEPYAFSLARFFCLGLPPWVGEEHGSDNWESSAWERGPGRGPTHPGRHF
jgi:Ion channel